ATPENKRIGLIHHSDRGSQYCCNDYVRLLKNNHIRISMTEHGDPYENAVAERMNGILKAEWLDMEEYTYATAIFRYATVNNSGMQPPYSRELLCCVS
ncbi:hypothetical protein EZS27_040309, partial [termite gut metagenome]